MCRYNSSCTGNCSGTCASKCTPTCVGEKGEPGVQGIPGMSSVIAQGEATLVGGTVTVACQPILATSLVILSRKTGGGVLGELSYTVTRGVQFVITSDNPLDTSTIAYIVV